MRILINIIRLPLRLLFYPFLLFLYQRRKKGEHVFIDLPIRFATNQKSTLQQLVNSEEKQLNFLEFLQIFKNISKAPKIRKVSIRVQRIEFGFAELFNIAQAIETLKQQGIEVSGYALTGGVKTLLLLSYCQTRYSFSSGEFHCVLPSLESFFYAGLLKKELNIEVESYASGDFKALGEPFSRTSFSKPARENLEQLIVSLQNTITSEFSKNTDLPEDLLQAPVLLAETLKEKGFFNDLVDEESFMFFSHYENFQNPDENEKAKKLYRDSSVGSMRFLQRFRSFSLFPKQRKIICVLPLKGNIILGKVGEEDNKSDSIHAYGIIQILRELREDDLTAAVLLEIDTGGGSAFASELIYQEIRRLSQKKPVYAYFQNTCASGGYYIAAACKKMYATPYCVTGSIGTVLLRPNLKGLYNKFGITKDRIGFYPLREIHSEYGKLSAKAKKYLQGEIERSKSQFYQRVFDSRKISAEELNHLAEGRVFSGADFFEHKMLDSLGTIRDCIEDIKKDIGEKEVYIEYELPTLSVRSYLDQLSPFSWQKALKELQSQANRRELEYRSYVVEDIRDSFLGAD
ncbi:MAG: signal peptide peptidase SppA [Spirochaetota bacterium]